MAAAASNWQVWRHALHVPEPLNAPITVILARNVRDTTYTYNLLVVKQLTDDLLQPLGISRAKFDDRISRLPHSKTLLETDTFLIGQLKRLGIVSGQTTSVKLCSPNTLATVLYGLGMTAVAACVKPLAHVPRSGALANVRELSPPPRPAASAPALAAFPTHPIRPVLSQSHTPTLPGLPSISLGVCTPARPHISSSAGGSAARGASTGAARPPGGVGGLGATSRRHFYPADEPFPTTLPECAPNECVGKRTRFGLLQEFGAYKGNYAKLPADIPLRHELPAYASYASNAIQLDRPSGPAGSATLDDHIKVISKVLGYLYKFQNVPRDCLSLALFSNQTYIMQYAAFIKAKSDSMSHVLNDLYKCQRVVEYLQATNTDGGADSAHCPRAQHLRKVHTMLAALTKNIYRAFPHGKDGRVDVDAPPPLPDKRTLLCWQVELRARALAAMDEDEGAPALSLATAEMVQEWCLSEWLCNNVPAIRLTCLRSVQIPATPDQPYRCRDRDCTDPACRGNRLELVPNFYYSAEQDRAALRPIPQDVCAWKPTRQEAPALGAPRAARQQATHELQLQQQHVERRNGVVAVSQATVGGGKHTKFMDSDDEDEAAELSSNGDSYAGEDEHEASSEEEAQEAAAVLGSIASAGVPVMRLVLPHHKNEDEWSRHPLTLTLPHNMAAATGTFIYRARPVLVGGPDASTNKLFVRPGLGTSMEDSQHLSSMWQGMQDKYQPLWTPHFPPKAFRDIHVEDRVMQLSQAVAATGVEIDGDAAVMQNSRRVWPVDYQKCGAYVAKMVAAVIDRMTTWREQQLAQLLPPPQAEEGQMDVEDSDGWNDMQSGQGLEGSDNMQGADAGAWGSGATAEGAAAVSAWRAAGLGRASHAWGGDYDQEEADDW